ncbi:hypothetical protein D3C87_1572940 [compost metagenome]
MRAVASAVDPVFVQTVTTVVTGQFDQGVASETVGAAELEVTGLPPVFLLGLLLGQVKGDVPHFNAVGLAPHGHGGLEVRDNEADLVEFATDQILGNITHGLLPYSLLNHT